MRTTRYLTPVGLLTTLLIFGCDGGHGGGGGSGTGLGPGTGTTGSLTASCTSLGGTYNLTAGVCDGTSLPQGNTGISFVGDEDANTITTAFTTTNPDDDTDFCVQTLVETIDSATNSQITTTATFITCEDEDGTEGSSCEIDSDPGANVCANATLENSTMGCAASGGTLTLTIDDNDCDEDADPDTVVMTFEKTAN